MRRNFLRFGKRNGGPNSNIGLQEDYPNEDFEDVEAPVSQCQLNKIFFFLNECIKAGSDVFLIDNNDFCKM